MNYQIWKDGKPASHLFADLVTAFMWAGQHGLGEVVYLKGDHKRATSCMIKPNRGVVIYDEKQIAEREGLEDVL